VPLGIDLHNENKVDEMCKILEAHHMYVPTIASKKKIALPHGEFMEVPNTDMWNILLGGDQLTVARARGAALVTASHDTTKDQLKGPIPTIEDWHCRMTLMKVCVIFKQLI
jgi:L1 cell adhesion molecule like protein